MRRAEPPDRVGIAAVMAASPAVPISDSRSEVDFAESLASRLPEHGVAAWFDANDLKPGGHWRRQILAAVDAADCLMLVVSRSRLASAHVRGEWARAHAERP